MNSIAKRYDFRIGIIEQNFGEAFARYADQNLAGWVLDRLSDERPAAVRGPLASVRACDAFFSSKPEWAAMAKGGAK
jgi:hypothetical protein